MNKYNDFKIYFDLLIETEDFFSLDINTRKNLYTFIDEYYNNNMFDGVYTTNLSYIPKSYQEKPWLHVCDCSKMMAEIVYDLHNDLSISELLKDKSGPIKMLEKKFNNNKKD